MTTRPALAGLLARHGAAHADPSRWAEGAAGVAARPSAHLRLLAQHREEPYRTALDRWGDTAGAIAGRVANPMRRYNRAAGRILRRADPFAALDAAAFDAQMIAVRAGLRIARDPARRRVGRAEEAALAVLVEAVRRVHGFRPHPEQLIGVMALLEGAIAEMATGEGKTLTAAVAATVAAWRGLPVHVVTSNDYLAARDAELGAGLFRLCGVTAASVTTDTEPGARGAAYGHDIVYTTAQNMLADHLRDGLALATRNRRAGVALAAARGAGRAAQDGTVQRGAYQVIVDEADSVLIDEAITPLIISAERPDDLLERAATGAVRLARALEQGRDYTLDHTLRSLDLTDAGRRALTVQARALGPFWARADRAEELVRMALYAEHLMVQDQHFVIEDGKVVLVDELTGRLARQRTLSLGMQQVLEARLGLEISPPSQVRARLSFQRYFRGMPRVGGMTGTAREARSEFARAYGLSVVRVPTHRRTRRSHLRTRAFPTRAAKLDAIVRDALGLAEAGRAVLIGVRSVDTSDALARAFARLAPGREVAVLNAVADREEAAIVARAGQPGRLTIATNMAGRGTDIAIDPAVRATGGLHVIIGEINDFARIDRQLIGRCARQGDPGSTRTYLAHDDDLFRRFLPGAVAAVWPLVMAVPPLRAMGAQAMVRLAQARAERLARSQRKQALQAEIEIEKGMM